MITVEDAQARIAAAVSPMAAERVALADLAGRVLAEDVLAMSAQPPAPVSAMDGYAVRLGDGEAPRRIIGTAPAGHPFQGTVGANEAVRIFTGGVVPDGADAIVIQEEAEAGDGIVRFQAAALRPDYIRPAGLDFAAGSVLAKAGKRLTARDLALLAAGDIASARVRQRPRVAFASIGDELSRPGEARKAGGIVASSGYGLAAMIAAWGGEAVDLGILPDRAEDIAAITNEDADLLVTLGGVSVGDHDLVQKALGEVGFEREFWKVAMRPGKPLLFGKIGQTPLLGLPGNPVSALVGAILFLKPAIETMLGLAQPTESYLAARVTSALPGNDSRLGFLRARLSRQDGELWAEPFVQQDSAMLSVFAAADALIVRRPGADAATPGEQIEIMVLPE